MEKQTIKLKQYLKQCENHISQGINQAQNERKRKETVRHIAGNFWSTFEKDLNIRIHNTFKISNLNFFNIFLLLVLIIWIFYVSIYNEYPGQGRDYLIGGVVLGSGPAAVHRHMVMILVQPEVTILQ